jgi:shikimate kinase
MGRNIILIGYMGCGKTSVGARLSKRLSYHFLDTDAMIEKKAKDTVSRIFAVHGEEYFRTLETELLKELQPKADRTVLSTGGGLPLREQNAVLLKEMGFVVYLKASKETTLQRLRGDTTRPLLQGGDAEQRIESMLAYRVPIYEKTAHAVITTDDKSVDEIVALIRELYVAHSVDPVKAQKHI